MPSIGKVIKSDEKKNVCAFVLIQINLIKKKKIHHVINTSINIKKRKAQATKTMSKSVRERERRKKC
jgi:hypothetical protein